MKDYFSLGFSLAPGVGPKGYLNLIKSLGTEQKAWEAEEADFKKAGIGKANFSKFEKFRKSFNHSVYFEKMEKARVDYISYNEKWYSGNLKKISNPPIGLFLKGNKKLLLEKNIIAVVGSRKITNYGRQVTENLVSGLCSYGLVVISGMALGIDATAHKNAIESKGSTIAVLGCGVDCPFPRENEKLYEEILDSGGLIVSEYPLGMAPSAGTFPARNRIIAGISSSVLITEAAEDSGSLITAQLAVEQGKTVFAVPGPITSKTSAGTLMLLKQGAIMVSSVSDILDSFNLKSQNSKLKSQSMEFLKLTNDEEKVYKVLESDELTADEVSRLTKIKPNKISVILSEMELKGLVFNSNGKIRLSAWGNGH